MKQILLALVISFVFGAFFVSSAHAAEVVGSESYEVSWDGVPADVAERFQVYYNQADGGAANTVFDGLTNASRRVWLKSLKPCTTYNWSVKALKQGKSWWVRQGSFTTGGTCETPKTPVSAGASLVKDVGTWSNATSTKYGSSTISWSPVNHASHYVVYYRTASDATYVHSVKVPSQGNSVTINHLTPGVKYFYRVAAWVNGREQWYSEKTLQEASGEKPVLGVTTKANGSVAKNIGGGYKGILGTMSSDAQTTQVLGTKTCTTGRASVSVRVPNGVTAAKVHVFYGTWAGGNYQHALRDLSGTVREVTINHLDTCATYYYQVAVVGDNGRVHWQGEKVLSVWP